MSESDSIYRRLEMVDKQIAARGIRDPRILEAMRLIPREAFLPPEDVPRAYEDRALPLGEGQTISQPYIVALMTDALGLRETDRVLEVGTGSGYQTAILARLAREVVTIERIASLQAQAARRLAALGLTNVAFHVGDGSLGWPALAPFDRIIVTAAAPTIVRELVDQLVEGGRLVIPVGEEGDQQLFSVERCRGRTIERAMIAVRFVRLIGAGGFSK